METTASGDLMDSFTSSYPDICRNKTDQLEYAAIFLPLMSILLVCNGILLIAVATNWSILRQNIVHRYLISCLVSAIAFCILSGYEFFHTEYHADNIMLSPDDVLQRYNSSDVVHRRVMYGWAYRKCLVVATLLIMEFNVAALSSAVSDHTQFVGRYSDPKPLNRPPPDHQKLKKTLFHMRLAGGRKCKAVFMISSAWIIPLILSIPTAFDWNCVEYCQCLPAYRSVDTCAPPNDTEVACGRVWLPMSQSFIFAVALLHTAASVIIFTLLGIVIRKFYQTHAPRKTKSSLTESKRRKIGKVNALGRRNSHGGFKRAETTDRSHSYHGTMTRSKSSLDVRFESMRNPREKTRRNDSELPQVKKSKGDEIMFSPANSSSSRKSHPPLPSTIKLLIAVAFSSFLSVSPIVIICVYDVLAPASVAPPDGIEFIIVGSLTFLHATALPIILLTFMSGLRKSCSNMLLKCPCLLTTEVITRRQRSEATLDDKAIARNRDSGKATSKFVASAEFHGSLTVKGNDSSKSSAASVTLSLTAQNSVKESSSADTKDGKLVSPQTSVNGKSDDAPAGPGDEIVETDV